MGKNRHTYPEKDEDDLILGQEGQQDEQMKFDDENRPAPDVEDDLRDKQTPYKKVDFPDTEEGDGNFEELLASEEYKNALDKVEEIMGTRDVGIGQTNKFMQLTMTASMSAMGVMREQVRYAGQLEELAERVVREYFKIPENALQFNFKLSSQAIKTDNKPSKQELEQRDRELVDDVNSLTQERAKRRLINAMTQGHSVEKSYLFNNVADELINITNDRNIIEKYSIITAMAILGYWHISKETNQGIMSGDEDAGGGKARLDSSTNPPTVNAEAVIFPFLIHEGIKGVMEFLGKERDPEDAEKSQTAMELEDQLQHEIWDIRLGPAIWRKLVSLFPNAIVEDEDKRKLQFYIYSNIANLPVKEFLILMKEVLSGSEDGRSLIAAMYYDLTMVIDDEEVTANESHFKNKMREVMENHRNDEPGEIDDFLAGLGITLSPN